MAKPYAVQLPSLVVHRLSLPHTATLLLGPLGLGVTGCQEPLMFLLGIPTCWERDCAERQYLQGTFHHTRQQGWLLAGQSESVRMPHPPRPRVLRPQGAAAPALSPVQPLLKSPAASRDGEHGGMRNGGGWRVCSERQEVEDSELSWGQPHPHPPALPTLHCSRATPARPPVTHPHSEELCSPAVLPQPQAVCLAVASLGRDICEARRLALGGGCVWRRWRGAGGPKELNTDEGKSPKTEEVEAWGRGRQKSP